MVSKEEVIRVAKLARIHVEESEVETIKKKFSSILDHFKFLSEANTNDIAPMFHAAESVELRADVAEEPIEREVLLRNAPETSDHCFKIPRVVGGADE